MFPHTSSYLCYISRTCSSFEKSNLLQNLNYFSNYTRLNSNTHREEKFKRRYRKQMTHESLKQLKNITKNPYIEKSRTQLINPEPSLNSNEILMYSPVPQPMNRLKGERKLHPISQQIVDYFLEKKYVWFEHSQLNLKSDGSFSCTLPKFYFLSPVILETYYDEDQSKHILSVTYTHPNNNNNSKNVSKEIESNTQLNPPLLMKKYILVDSRSLFEPEPYPQRLKRILDDLIRSLSQIRDKLRSQLSSDYKSDKQK